MKRLFAVAAIFTSLGLLLGFHLRGGSPIALAGQQQEKCAATNGDVNADGVIDLSDAVTILGYLFLGSPTELVPLCAPSATVLSLPATGQTKCYDGAGNQIDCRDENFPGQDGFNQSGCPNEERFVDLADGTVIDSCTRLMWQKEAAPETRGWQDALKYCSDLVLAGHNDWRLPNVRELQSIVDYGRFYPAIDPVFSEVSQGARYWTSSSSVFRGDPPATPEDTWIVSTDGGYVIIHSDKDDLLFVRAVRNAP